MGLAVSELGENLIKYGDASGELDAGTIGIRIDGDRIVIRAVSRVSSPEDARRVAEIVAQISDSGRNVRELYRARLTELFENPALPRAELGLLRMAFEGSFRLSCSFAAPELQVLAERTCKAKS